MSKSPNAEYPLVGGEIFTVSSFAEIAEVEVELVQPFVYPDMAGRQTEEWKVRSPIASELQAARDSHGRLANFRLEVMNDPYLRLISGVQEGWKMGANQRRIDDIIQQIGRHYLGFYVLADEFSSGKGYSGELKLASWYIPTWLPGSSSNAIRKGESGIRRVVGQPNPAKSKGSQPAVCTNGKFNRAALGSRRAPR